MRNVKVFVKDIMLLLGLLAALFGGPAMAETWSSNGWADALDSAIYENGLVDVVPSDVKNYVSGVKYEELNAHQRMNFWKGLLVEISRQESNFNPVLTYKEKFRDSQNRLVVSSGLFQLSLESAQLRPYRCSIQSQEDLLVPELNIRCAVNILSYWVKRDGVISIKHFKKGWLGGARYWSVLRGTSKHRNIIAKMRGYRFDDPNFFLGDGAEGGGANSQVEDQRGDGADGGGSAQGSEVNNGNGNNEDTPIPESGDGEPTFQEILDDILNGGNGNGSGQ